MKVWLEKVGELPARKALLDDAVITEDPIIGHFVQQLPYAYATFFIDEKINREAIQALMEAVVLKNEDPKAALDAAVEKVNAVRTEFFGNTRNLFNKYRVEFFKNRVSSRNPVFCLKIYDTFPRSSQTCMGLYFFITVPVIYFLIVRIFPCSSPLTSVSVSGIFFPLPSLCRVERFQILFADPMFWKALRNTFLYTLIIVPGGLILGLAIALMLNNITRLIVFFRVLYFAPLCDLAGGDQFYLEVDV